MNFVNIYEFVHTMRPATTQVRASILPPSQVLSDVTMLFIAMMQLFLASVLFIAS